MTIAIEKAQQKARDWEMISPKPSQESPGMPEIIASLYAASNIEEVMQHISHGVIQAIESH